MNSEWWDLTDYEKHPSVLIYFKKWEGGGYIPQKWPYICFKVFAKFVRFIMNTFGTMIKFLKLKVIYIINGSGWVKNKIQLIKKKKSEVIISWLYHIFPLFSSVYMILMIRNLITINLHRVNQSLRWKGHTHTPTQCNLIVLKSENQDETF